MAQYDVYAIAGSGDLFLELQHKTVQSLSTKVGAPLVRKLPGDRPIPGLQPELVVGGQSYIMLTQHLFSIPTSELRKPIANLLENDYRITSAVDLLFHGG
jgi:hypothetical protein